MLLRVNQPLDNCPTNVSSSSRDSNVYHCSVVVETIRFTIGLPRAWTVRSEDDISFNGTESGYRAGKSWRTSIVQRAPETSHEPLMDI